MNLKKCTIDELAMELARRGEFILLLPDGHRKKGNGAEVNIHMREPRKAVNVLNSASKLLEDVIKGGGRLPDNIKLLKKTCGMSGIKEVEVTDINEILDPWEPNKIGDYNPWDAGKKEKEEEEKATDVPDVKIDHDLPSDEIEIQPEPNYDPWQGETH